MVSKVVAGLVVALGLVVEWWPIRPPRGGGKRRRTPAAASMKMACCKDGTACAALFAKLGCRATGKKCCDKDAGCRHAVQECCKKGDKCCDEVKACCGPKK